MAKDNRNNRVNLHLICLVSVLLLLGCGCGHTGTPATVTEQWIKYEPNQEEIVGATTNGLYLVRGSFVRQALYDAQTIRELKGRIRQNELKTE